MIHLGSTFGNINVIKKEYSKEEVRNKIIDWYQKNGYEVSNEESDINIKIIYQNHSRWFTIYIDIIDGLFPEGLKEISENFCSMLKTDILSVMVYDSDLLALDLEYADNKEAGLFISEPSHIFYEADQEEVTKAISPFKYILNQETDIDKFENIYKEDYVFQEERLIALAKLLGIDSKHIVLRYDDFEYLGDKDYQTIDVSFSIIDKKEKPFSIIKEGLPKLEINTYSYHMVNGSKNISSFLNVGGPSTGLQLFIGGEVIEKSINNQTSSFKFSKVEAFYNKDNKLNTNEYYLKESSFEVYKDVNDRYFLKADFADFKIPDGIVVNPICKKYGKKTQDTMYGYKIVVRFTLLSMDENLEGAVLISATPTENFKQGMASHQITILKE